MFHPYARQLPIGAEATDRGITHFRVWAPRRRSVEVVLYNSLGMDIGSHRLVPENDGYFSAHVIAPPGTLYRFQLDGTPDHRYPDPASRFQPAGPHGPSQIVDRTAFPWTDAGWRGVGLRGQVVHEMHIGTFTPEGTWAAATRELPELARAGLTLLEIMPIADFAGRFGWGYDGVNLFAPTRLYGGPDDFRRFIDHAHSIGLGVILDVVYNHFGPAGNYLAQFSDHYCTDRYENEWGEAINFDAANARPVREFYLANAEYWIGEYHLDGLRLDATQQIFDRSPRHIITEIADRVRATGQRLGRDTVLVAENEPQDARLIRPTDRGGLGLDGLWNDDFHHTAIVALGGRREAYYTDYRGSPQELISSIKRGFLYQGQHYRWQHKRRGTPTAGLAPMQFIHYLENHDQVANSARGDRLCRHVNPACLRAITALLLLAPETPLLFQGQEFGTVTPFLFFADHEPELAEQVRRGRTEFLAQFPTIKLPPIQDRLDDPADPRTFERCKLDLTERERNAEIYALHRDLLYLRRSDPVIGRQGEGGLDGAVLGAEALVLRYFTAESDEDRLLLVNLGLQLDLVVAPEPLLAPPDGATWAVRWSSEDPRYGGLGTPALEPADVSWRIPPQCAILLIPEIDANHRT